MRLKPHSVKDLKSGGRPFSRAFAVSALLIFAVFAIRLFSASSAPFVLDEIWSLWHIKAVNSPLEIFTSIKHDNNHVLNSLYMYYFAQGSSLITARLLSIVSGIISLLLCAVIARKEHSNTAALLAVFFVGFSPPLLFVFSSARGYALMIASALLCYYLFSRYLKTGSKCCLLLFWLFSIIGLLAHSTFLIAILAYLFLSLLYKGTEKPRKSFLMLLPPHLPSLIFFGFWYFYYISQAVIGGGEMLPISYSIGQFAAFFMSFKNSETGWLSAFIFLLFLLVSSFIVLRKKMPSWPFYAFMIFVSSAMVVAAANPRFFYWRYLIVLYPFMYILISCCFAELMKRKNAIIKLCVVGLIFAYAVLSISDNFKLASFGQCRFGELVDKILSSSKKDEITVASLSDFGASLMLNYHCERLKCSRITYYFKQKYINHEIADYLICLKTHFMPTPDECLKRFNLTNYKFVGAYEVSDLSDFNWYLYKNSKTAAQGAEKRP